VHTSFLQIYKVNSLILGELHEIILHHLSKYLWLHEDLCETSFPDESGQIQLIYKPHLFLYARAFESTLENNPRSQAIKHLILYL